MADVTVTRSRFEETVFLDRDGTINRKAPDGEYVTAPEQLVLLPGAGQAIRALNDAGFRVLVVTNQRGIALGKLTEQDLSRIHAHLRGLLAEDGARVDAIYHCPHDEARCRCRKPGVGLFERAAADHPELRLERSTIFGDSSRDMAAGMRLGMTRVLIGQPNPGHDDGQMVAAAHHTAPTLREAVEWFLGLRGRASGTGAGPRP